jgi:hypothetical protein
MTPPFSLRSTDSFEVKGPRVESEEGVNHSRKLVAVAPRKLKGFFVREIMGRQHLLTEIAPYVQRQIDKRSDARFDS